MYVPPIFQVTELNLIWDIVEEIRLGCLVTAGKEFGASHLPFMIERGRGSHGTLIGHMARANPQWRDDIDSSAVLVTFLGPNSYISPAWYATSPRAPTWNFVTVEVHGILRLVDEAAARREMVLRLSQVMEPADSAWAADAEYVDRLLPGIVGFEIEVTRAQAQLRLSQQNNTEDRARVHAALAHGSPRQQAVAQAMDKYLNG